MAACLAGYSEKLQTWERGVFLMRGCSVESDLVVARGYLAQVWEMYVLIMLSYWPDV